MVTQEQIDFYNKNGFLLIENLIDKENIEALRDEAQSVVKDEVYTNRLDMHKNPNFAKLHKNPKILEIIDRVLNHKMIPIGSIFFYCKPDNPLENGSIWHQDNYAPKSPIGSYLVVGVPLDDADKENGSLIVVPKSHKLGDVYHKPSKNFEKDEDGNIVNAYPIGDECEVPEGFEQLQLEYKAGDLLLMHGHTIHMAYKNTHKTRWRRKIYMHYIKNGHPFWPGWNAKRELIERD